VEDKNEERGGTRGEILTTEQGHPSLGPKGAQPSLRQFTLQQGIEPEPLPCDGAAGASPVLKKKATSVWVGSCFPFVPGKQGRGRISVQPRQPEIEILGLGSGLRLVRKKREKEQSPGVPGPSWLSGEWMGPGALAQHSSRHWYRLISP